MSQSRALESQGAFSSLRYRKTRDRIIELILLAAGLVAVFTTAAIVFVLVYESLGFFREVSLVEFLTGTEWMPQFADPKYGILPLICGTLVTTAVALSVALPVGTIVAIYLSEFAPFFLREIAKGLGRGIRDFKRATREIDDEVRSSDDDRRRINERPVSTPPPSETSSTRPGQDKSS